MRTTFRRATATTLMAAAGLTTLAALATGGAGAATAESLGTHEAAVTRTAEQAAPSQSVPETRKEAGVVLEGSGDGVLVFLYENSEFGSSLQVVLGDPEDDRIGSIDQAAPFIVDGRLDVTVDVQGAPVRLSGTVTPAGKAERIGEQLQDAGEMHVVKGTHTQLAADVTAEIDGESVAVDFAPAFAFDLEVLAVDLYGPHA